MPASVSDYALLQRKYQRENLLQEVSSHRSSAREREKYHLAAHRNSLEEQRANLRDGLERLSVPVQDYYLGRIADLGRRIDSSKKRYPQFRSHYDGD